jgi:hypothetical protein
VLLLSLCDQLITDCRIVYSSPKVGVGAYQLFRLTSLVFAGDSAIACFVVRAFSKIDVRDSTLRVVNRIEQCCQSVIGT